MKGHALLIDDNRIDLLVVSSALERLGYACHSFTSFTDASKWLDDNVPQIIFLDLQMPDVSGYDVLAHIKKQNQWAQVPIIIMSGKNKAEDVMAAVKLGASDYVIKPIDPLIVQEKVGRITNTSEEFGAVSWPSAVPHQAYIGYSLKILDLSEFGMRVETPLKIKPNETVELVNLPANVFPGGKVYVRCLNCEVRETDGVSNILFTFIGVSESQRQTIRKVCRQFWIDSKKGRVL